MNALISPARPAAQPLTPAERIETLIDAITAHHTMRVALDQYAESTGLKGFTNGNPDSISRAELVRFDEMVQAADHASDALWATAKTLMADGLLERCAALLRNESRRSC